MNQSLQFLLPFVLIGGSVILWHALRNSFHKPEGVTPVLSAIRSRTEDRAAIGLDPRRRNTFVFVPSSGRERLNHRIDDQDGLAIGSALEQPRPAWWEGESNLPKTGKRSVHVYDGDDVKVIEVLRPFVLFPRFRRLRVTDANQTEIGTVAPAGLSRFALFNRDGNHVGTLHKKGQRYGLGYGVDFVIADSTGSEVGRISDFAHIAQRLEAEAGSDTSRGHRHSHTSQSDEHVLEITQHASDDLRLLALASSAALYTMLQKPFFDNG